MDDKTYSRDQAVRIVPHSLSGPRAIGDFRVVRGYPMPKGPTLYRIRSVADRSERMVPGTELSVVIPHAFADNGRASKVVALFPEVLGARTRRLTTGGPPAGAPSGDRG